MFPDPCGDQLEQLVVIGMDPATVIPDDFYPARGGKDPPPDGRSFSVGVGPSPESAAAAVPHGQVAIARARDVRHLGGTVTWVPELSRYNTLNKQHANVSHEGAAAFAQPIANTVPRANRIDGRQK